MLGVGVRDAWIALTAPAFAAKAAVLALPALFAKPVRSDLLACTASRAYLAYRARSANKACLTTEAPASRAAFPIAGGSLPSSHLLPSLS